MTNTKIAAEAPATRRERSGSDIRVAELAVGSLLVAGALAAILPSPATAQDAPTPIAAWSRTNAAAEDAGAPTERGAAVFNNWCGACHSRGPLNAPGTTSLQNKYQGALPAALEDRTDLTADIIELYVRNGIATMPFYRKTEVSDADLAALAEYLVEK
jgi:mono/diheme cytochrome c family protein